jgi:hypothetical protein
VIVSAKRTGSLTGWASILITRSITSEFAKRENEMDTKLLVGRYIREGFTESHRFDDPGNPYTLLINPKTLDKVRIYDDGRVLKTNERGKYIKEEA